MYGHYFEQYLDNIQILFGYYLENIWIVFREMVYIIYTITI